MIVGSGKTATDACIWLLRERGVDPDAICWVRPRDPWMLNRALIQPDPAIYLGMVADMMRVCGRRRPRSPTCSSRLEDAGIMLRIDRVGRTRPWPRPPPSACGSSTCCAPSRTSYASGTSDPRRRGRLDLADGSVALADDALIVNCAADGLKNPAAGADLAAGRDHPADDPGRVPVLRRRTRRVRRGDPRRRCREEPAVPALVVRQHPPTGRP